MSTTRLLVLGVVRIFQPVHGYFVRRELLSWDTEKWANINPGSVYNALRSLTREGYLLESPATEGGTSEHSKPEVNRPSSNAKSRTVYRLTQDGYNELQSLLRNALWQVDQWDSSTLLGGLTFMHFLHREEVIDAMQARAEALRAILNSTGHEMRDLQERGSAPAQTAELFMASRHRWNGELAWCEEFTERLRQGYYLFQPEPGWDSGPRRDGSWPGPLEKASQT